MQCPMCGVDLNMMERQGVEIDYCPKCRGVWLDRGELDKIIERSAGPEYAAPPPQFPAGRDRSPDYGHRHHDTDYDPRYGKKRKGFLGELFDFD